MPDEQKKVLVVEDDETIRNLIRLYLVRFPITFFEAKDGLEGLALAARTLPDLIITDITMPRMDGLELIKALQAVEKMKHIPIIVITGTALPDPATLMKEGAAAILQKPVAHAQMRQVISVFLK
jgi:CheY-like chemotaxis protein